MTPVSPNQPRVPGPPGGGGTDDPELVRVRSALARGVGLEEALNDAPLAVNQREEVGTAVQEDEGTTRAQALLREHAGHAFVARRRETSSHRRGHGMRLRGMERHLLSYCLAV